jgi:hypothetical protein
VRPLDSSDTLPPEDELVSTGNMAQRPEPGEEGPLLEVDIDGGRVRLRSRYDPQLVDRLRGLPGRRFIAERGEWVLPARREGLIALARLLAELGGQAELSEHARRRLERHGPGGIEVRDGEFELSVRPRPRLLERIRTIPERRYLTERRRWRVPLTRAGALAMLALVDDGELVGAPRTLSRLRQLAAGCAGAGGPDGERPADNAGPSRAAPSPHWRHITRGPIFRANTDRHEWVDGIGWCVRVRVDPKKPGEEERTMTGLLDERPRVDGPSVLAEPLHHDQGQRQRCGDHGEQRVRQAAGADPTRTWQKPGRPPRERPP